MGGNIMAKIFDVANWFLSKESMSHKKLQKLAYYVEAWGWALYERDVIEDTNFEAWVHGPVSKILYDRYRYSGWNDIESVADNSNKFNAEELELLESVWLTYGKLSANELEALTHSEIPWRAAREGCADCEACSNEISPELMKTYYRSIYTGE